MARTDYMITDREDYILVEVTGPDAEALKRLAAYHEMIKKRRKTDEYGTV